MRQFDKMFSTHHDRLKLYCNVRIGVDITFDELLPNYDAVVLAYGAGKRKSLKIPGIHAKNVFSGDEFVHWYNGFPEAVAPSLNVKNVVIIGVGNVALDCCRILLRDPSELTNTYMSKSVLELLKHSSVQKVTILGRRGPLEASFTTKELREQINLRGCSFSAMIDSEDEKAIHSSLTTLQRPKRRLIQLLLKNVATTLVQPRQCQIFFRRSPCEVRINKEGAVKSIVLKNERTKIYDILPCGMLIYCLGYENMVLSGLPKNDNGQLDMVEGVRVNMPNPSGTLVYATGWCSHPPRGVITQTQFDSANVSTALCKNLQTAGVSKPLEGDIEELLKERCIKYTLRNQNEET